VLNTALVLGLSALFTAALPVAPSAASLVAKLAATAGSLAWSFIANHFWTFQMTPERGRA
jgi:putative flippase GtrA